MKQSILSVKFPETGQTGNVLIIGGIISRCSMNMRRWFNDSEDQFRTWCKEHNLEIMETPCPDVDNYCYSDGTEKVPDEEVDSFEEYEEEEARERSLQSRLVP